MGVAWQPPASPILAVRRGGALAARLEETKKTVEEKFLAAGEILSQAIGGIDALVKSLDKLADTLNSDTVNATMSDLQAAAEKLNALPSAHIARLAATANLSRCRVNLAEQISDMHCSLAYMRAYTVNIKIVASGIGDNAGEFELFAKDIAACIDKGDKELKGLEADLSRLQRALDATTTQGEVLSGQIAKLPPSVPNELTANAAEMSEHYRRVSDIAGNVATLARDIHDQVGRILGALQIGDITRQRIEHIQQAIVQIDADEAVRSHAQKSRIVASLRALMAAHLAATAEDFYREVDKIDGSMASMAKGAHELLKLHDMAYSSGDGSSCGFLHNLSSRVEEVQRLVGKIEEVDLATIAVGQNSAKMAKSLGSRIEEIQLLKNDVQYMALNTTLKCCQIGEIGRPLSVIAIELRDHGGNLEKAAGESLAELDKLISAATAVSADRKTDGKKKSESLAAAEALSVAADRIRAARDRTESDIAAIASGGDAVLHTLEVSSQKLSFRKTIGGVLDLTADEMTSSAAEAFHRGDAVPELLVRMMEKLASRYTMAQEREIHRNFISDLGMNEAALVAAEKPDEEMAAELF